MRFTVKSNLKGAARGVRRLRVNRVPAARRCNRTSVLNFTVTGAINIQNSSHERCYEDVTASWVVDRS